MVTGFYTHEAHNSKTGEKIGLDVETLSGEQAPLSRLRRGCGPKVSQVSSPYLLSFREVGKFYFAMEAFESLVLPLLEPNKAIKLHVIDEVGRMELESEHFRDKLMALLASPQVAVFGSLPACRYGHDLPFVEAIKQRPDTAIFTLTKSNRDATALQVEELLLNIVGSANNPAPIPSIGIVSSPKLGASSISGDIESSYEVTHSVDNEEPLEKRRRTENLTSI
ncbi:hypothetical protein CY35_09G052700 [Sphagnum magellanicum]|nr:hypothetical protein CY35_09G052700 [Sphagnum magellanicum]